jgi:hypothetical protein
MRWDNQIALFIGVAFIVYVTVRGELPVYMGFLTSTASIPTPVASVAPVGAATTTTGSASTPSTLGAVANTGLKLITGGIF